MLYRHNTGNVLMLARGDKCTLSSKGDGGEMQLYLVTILVVLAEGSKDCAD